MIDRYTGRTLARLEQLKAKRNKDLDRQWYWEAVESRIHRGAEPKAAMREEHTERGGPLTMAYDGFGGWHCEEKLSVWYS